MVSTRAFLWTISRTVIKRPSLIPTALKLASSSRARNKKGPFKYLPSMKYLKFRIETQYGAESVDKAVLSEEMYRYLIWVKNY